MKKFSFDHLGFSVDGKEAYMVSGEFHYFRVPRGEWRRRLQLFKAAGGNCVATYVPWIIHEPSEGDIRFGDVDNRDLQAFLETVQEEGLKVVLRPGPYQYSELVNDGLPEWLLQEYPQVKAQDINGHAFRHSSISYLHPTFLEKARVYYKAFAEQVRPFMMENGGPVCMLQVDNELSGIHIWFGTLDYHPETMGFGKPDGRYPLWLERKYQTIERLNDAYQTEYTSFAQVYPMERAERTQIGSCRRVKDYRDFYTSTLAEYASLLASWLREDGLGGPICHNSANPGMNCLFTDVVDAMGENFLLGSDHYYTLNQSWVQNNPTPQYALRVLKSCDTMRALGMPPSVLELPGGSPSDTPPILPEDLLACYMTNLALGAKGVNYYVYTGGPNFPGTGENCNIYDYNAHVHADGSLNETYASLKTFGQFMKKHSWMQRAHRVASVQIGFEWNTLRSDGYDCSQFPYGAEQAGCFLEKGLLYTLMCSCYSPEMVLLNDKLDVTRPLIVPSPSVMSKDAQAAVVEFMEKGGKALILPVFAQVDTDYEPCSLLAELVQGAEFVYGSKLGPATVVDKEWTAYGICNVAVCEKLPEGAKVIAQDQQTGAVVGFEKKIGEGSLFWFGGAWEMSTFDQARMLEHLVDRMGGKPCVKSSNRNLFTSFWTDEEGRRILFVMNLYSGRQKTDLWVSAGGEWHQEQVVLGPMEVQYFELTEPGNG